MVLICAYCSILYSIIVTFSTQLKFKGLLNSVLIDIYGMLKYANGLFYVDNFYSCCVYEIVSGQDVLGRNHIRKLLRGILSERERESKLLPSENAFSRNSYNGGV